MDLKDLISMLCATYYFEARASPDQLKELLRLRGMYYSSIKFSLDFYDYICYYYGVNNMYNNDWKKENTRRFVLQLNNEKDKDIIDVLENESNMSAFIKACIREVVSKTTKE